LGLRYFSFFVGVATSRILGPFVVTRSSFHRSSYQVPKPVGTRPAEPTECPYSARVAVVLHPCCFCVVFCFVPFMAGSAPRERRAVCEWGGEGGSGDGACIVWQARCGEVFHFVHYRGLGRPAAPVAYCPCILLARRHALAAVVPWWPVRSL
jgi:hypothetical protein